MERDSWPMDCKQMSVQNKWRKKNKQKKNEDKNQ